MANNNSEISLSPAQATTIDDYVTKRLGNEVTVYLISGFTANPGERWYAVRVTNKEDESKTVSQKLDSWNHKQLLEVILPKLVKEYEEKYV